MRLNGLEIANQGGPEVIKAWVMWMNMKLKEEPLLLKVAAPCSLPARFRTGAAKVSSSTQWSFGAGEDLVLQSVYQEPNIHRDATTLKATFVAAPTNLKLLKDGFANMTLEMATAFQYFDGLEAWVGAQMTEAPALHMKKQGPQVFAPAIKPEELQGSEEWGAW
ncbi:hypothetical protein D9M72_137450 [compost metagenome]